MFVQICKRSTHIRRTSADIVGATVHDQATRPLSLSFVTARIVKTVAVSLRTRYTAVGRQ